MEVFIFLLFALAILSTLICSAGVMIGRGVDNDVMQNLIGGIFLAVPSVILFILCIVYIVTHYILNNKGVENMLKDKKLICIIGRTGSGKDTVREYMERKKGLKSVVSYTTRPKRANETDGIEHHFVSKEEFDDIMKTKEIAAYTKIEDPNTGAEGYEYCATIQGVLASDIYEIDPLGVKKLKEEFADAGIDRKIAIIYIHCPDEIRLERVKSGRGEEEIQNFEERNLNEDGQFTEFEDWYTKTLPVERSNCFWVENNSTLEELYLKVNEKLLQISYI